VKAEVEARWRGALLVCAKCSKKLGGGFGKDGRKPLAKALRRYLGLGKGRKAALGVLEVKCLGVCPRRAVVVVNAAAPDRWRLIAPGTDLGAVAALLAPSGHEGRQGQA
jgi:predicted metal-binding protein